MIGLLTLNIAFGIILITVAVEDFMSFKDKTIGEVSGVKVIMFFMELLLGSFLVVITLMSVAENAAKGIL